MNYKQIIEEERKLEQLRKEVEVRSTGYNVRL